jgi:hypothetical protein
MSGHQAFNGGPCTPAIQPVPALWPKLASRSSRTSVGVTTNACFGQYEATFRDNETDSTVLPRLTVDDLKDLGVAVVGHRRKIMSAIEELNATSVARADEKKPP